MTAVLESAAAQATQPAPKKRSKKLLLLVLALLLVAAGAGGAFFLRGGDAAEEPPPPPAEGAVVEVATMTSGLAGPEVHYAKVGFAVVLAEGADESLVAARFPLLRDAAISELATMAAPTLRTSEGMDALRASLSERATAIYPDGEVLRVVLTELVVQ